MSDTLEIQSHRGPYCVFFDDDALEKLNRAVQPNAHFIIDAKVADLYREQMLAVLNSSSVLRIEAVEESKSLDRFPAYVDHMVSHGIRRDHVIIAMGGGIIQDISCFLAATLLRGVDCGIWLRFSGLLSTLRACPTIAELPRPARPKSLCNVRSWRRSWVGSAPSPR